MLFDMCMHRPGNVTPSFARIHKCKGTLPRAQGGPAVHPKRQRSALLPGGAGAGSPAWAGAAAVHADAHATIQTCDGAGRGMQLLFCAADELDGGACSGRPAADAAGGGGDAAAEAAWKRAGAALKRTVSEARAPFACPAAALAATSCLEEAAGVSGVLRTLHA